MPPPNEAPKKRGRGQPKKITPHIARKIFFLYAKGLTDQEIAQLFGVHVDTISEFKKEAQYSESIRKIKEEADLRVINSLYQRAIGYEHDEEKIFCHEGEIVRAKTRKHYAPDTEAIKFWLMNRQREHWRKEIQHEDTRPNPATVRVFSRLKNEEITVVSRGDNQVDVLLGGDFVKNVKDKNNVHQRNGNG